jgi:ribosome-associated protein
MIHITPNIQLDEKEVEYQATLAQGPGGQHVNKTATAIQLKFDIRASSLPREVKQRLLGMPDQRISKDGVITIKARDERSQLRNKEDALQRLILMIRSATHVPHKRIPTKPGKAAKARRMDTKTKRGLVKSFRQKPKV